MLLMLCHRVLVSISRFTNPESFPHNSTLVQVASLNRSMAIHVRVGTGAQWQPAMGATSGPINWHSISNVGNLKYCSMREFLRNLSLTRAPRTLLRGLSRPMGFIAQVQLLGALSGKRFQLQIQLQLFVK